LKPPWSPLQALEVPFRSLQGPLKTSKVHIVPLNPRMHCSLSQQYLLQCAKSNKKQNAMHKIPLVQTGVLVIQICAHILGTYSLTFFLTYLNLCFLTNLLTLFLMIYLLTYLSDNLSDISFAIISDISFDIISDISFDKSFWHFFWHIF